VSDKKINVLVQFALERHPDLPDVPLLSELVPDQADKRALELYFTPAEMGRPFAGPPDLPADRVALLRTAFDRAVADPDLLAQAETMKLEIEPLPGAKVASYVDQLYAAPREISDRVVAFRNMAAQAEAK
jgi:tripartite-type tricarboxylate transporter receptor subunit TctC